MGTIEYNGGQAFARCTGSLVSSTWSALVDHRRKMSGSDVVGGAIVPINIIARFYCASLNPCRIDRSLPGPKIHKIRCHQARENLTKWTDI